MNNQNNNWGYPNPYGSEGNTPFQINGNNGYPTQQMNYNQVTNQSPKKGKSKIFILGIVVVAILVSLFFLFGKKENKDEKKENVHSVNRTIMIYMVGSDLEGKNGLASAELSHIMPSNIDLQNNHIILIAGGSKLWKNDYISASETSVYQLKTSGFEKVKQDSVKNMGDAKTLSDFLTYTYENYPAKKYELIFWNHGSGVGGLEIDNIYGDYLSFKELDTALENSPFHSKNKLDSILFINCLLGGLEMATVIDEYADYMIATEEVSYAHPFVDKFKFLEDIQVSDTGYEFGKKFIDGLSNNTFLKNTANSYNTPTTYSIIDLSKVEQVKKDLNSFVKKINLTQSYHQVAYARTNMFQYGGDETAFDTIDLYTFISKLQTLAPSEARKLMDSLKSSILYNYSTDEVSKGLSIYFPYNADKENIEFHLNSLSMLSNSSSDDYLTFIKNFDLHRRSNNSYFMDLSGNQVSSVNNDYSMQLSDSQKESFASASYMIFKGTADGFYVPIFTSDNISLEDDGKLIANFDGKILTALDTTTNQTLPISVVEKKNGSYMTPIQLRSQYNVTIKANAYIQMNKEEGIISSAVEVDEDSDFEVPLPSMTLVKMDDYLDLVFTVPKYQIVNTNGVFLKDWKNLGLSYSINAKVKYYQIQKTPLDKNENYYFAFQVKDLSNEVSYSKLVKIK